MFSVLFPYGKTEMAMAADLSRVKDREALAPRREPYWHRLRPGCFVGYRPSTREGAGTWIGRTYDDDQRRYRLKALGDFGELPSKDRFAAAKFAAEAFAATVEAGGLTEQKLETVADACRAFTADRPLDEARFKLFVYPDPIAKVKLTKLRRSQTKAWRQRLENLPALVSRRKVGEQTTRPRSLATVNRDMARLRTALGQFLPLGTPNTDAAWQEPLKPIKNATKRRTLYLARDQRRELLKHVAEEAEPLVRALCLLPLRPGAVAGLTAGDFDRNTSELTIGKDKAGNQRRIVVPATAAALFAVQAKRKPPAAPLFMRSNGLPWCKESWKRPIAEAARAAKLPVGVSAYTLRHSTITDLVTAGLPLLTVAQISGTSAEMIERHYGHLSRHAATEALAGLAL
jgi:integrase